MTAKKRTGHKRGSGRSRGGTVRGLSASSDREATATVESPDGPESDSYRTPKPYIPLPEAFVSSLAGLPGIVDPQELRAAMDSDPVTSIRFNPYKLTQKPEGRQVPWNRYGFYLDERPRFTTDPAFHAGAYYVQEPSSMFIEHIVRCVIGEDKPFRVLDLCAAPGGKTTLLSTLAGLEGLVVANEVVRHRAGVLAENVRGWGLGNVLVTNNDPSHFTEIRDFFDIILVDAPCSGEGMFRKNPESRGQWSPANVQMCALRQRRILADVWNSLAPGGVLIYTTCTFNRSENEDNVAWLCEKLGAEGVRMDIPADWGVVTSEIGEGPYCYRFYPGKVKGEGFFAAAVRKTDDKRRIKIPHPRREPLSAAAKSVTNEVKKWLGQPEYMHIALVGDNIYAYYAPVFDDISSLAGFLSPLYSGVMAGQVFGSSLRPAHSLALFHDLSPAGANIADICLEDALRYLRKEDIDASLFTEGLNLVAFEGLPIGWLKRIGGRCNNMYPKELRILK